MVGVLYQGDSHMLQAELDGRCFLIREFHSCHHESYCTCNNETGIHSGQVYILEDRGLKLQCHNSQSYSWEHFHHPE